MAAYIEEKNIKKAPAKPPEQKDLMSQN